MGFLDDVLATSSSKLSVISVGSSCIEGVVAICMGVTAVSTSVTSVIAVVVSISVAGVGAVDVVIIIAAAAAGADAVAVVAGSVIDIEAGDIVIGGVTARNSNFSSATAVGVIIVTVAAAAADDDDGDVVAAVVAGVMAATAFHLSADRGPMVCTTVDDDFSAEKRPGPGTA